MTGPATIALLLPAQNISTPTPLLLPEPTFSPETGPTSTRVINPTPTSTPTSSPTAAPLPSAPATSTPTLAPSPTATSLPPATPTPTPTVTPQAGIKYVVIISVDGMRPDALEMADTPHLDKLIAHGAYSAHAQTISLSETLPAHASMLSGMLAEKHGILWGVPYIGWPGMNGPTLFNVAHDAGLSTAMVFGKEKMNYLVLPNSVDKLYGVNSGDTEIKNQAVTIIQAGLPNVLFVHLPDTDRVGHMFGWMSTNQLQSVTFADSMIGEIVTALENDGYMPNTLLIVTADHGGHSKSNGDDSPEDRTIPWLAVGPGIPAGATLTGNINIYDTAPTVLYALNLPIPEVWDGLPILEIFQ
ncbi:MAG: alkaline phosphatase family protein [Anaerolineae bacterium]|nr:alkaline phosphatase family protein [Anaerolineae bacterium]